MKKRIKLFVLFMFCSSTFYAQELGKEILIEVQLPQKIEYHIYTKEEQNLFKVDDEYQVNRITPASASVSLVPTKYIKPKTSLKRLVFVIYK